MKTLLAAAVLLAATTLAGAADWTPETWADLGTLQLRTVGPEEGEHWSTLWLVVLDGELYVRLGTKAAGRVEASTAPDLGLRVGGSQFDHVRGVPAPEMAGQVARAMKDKYWTDVFVRWMDHPLTLRLEPAAP